MGKAEDHVEKYLRDEVIKAGGLCYKFTSGDSGVPDRIVILKGHVIFVEAKSAVGVVRRLQIAIHRRMRGRGAYIHVTSTRPQVDALIKLLIENPLAPDPKFQGTTPE